MLWIITFVILWEHGFVGGTPYVAIVDGDAYMTWTITNLENDTNRYILNPAGNASLMVFHPTPHIFDNRSAFTGDLSQGIVSFTLSGVKLSDAGKYTFAKSAGTANPILGGQLLVVVATPNIQGIMPLSSPAVVGREYKLNCSTESRSAPFDHNLTMYSEWKENGVIITVGYGYSVNGTILTFSNLSRKENGSNITCRAFEDQRKISAESSAFVMNVLYGPDAGSITLFPNQMSYEQVESSSLSVNCSADCYPNCQYRWTGPGLGNYPDTGALIIHHIKKDQAGVFTCSATNPRINNTSATATLSVTVFYGPDNQLQLAPVNTSYRLLEEATIPDINCTSSCSPPCEFSWTGPVPSFTGVISLGTVNRSVRGNYTCSGKNPRTQKQTDSNVITVTVIYGPDTPVLAPSSINYTLNESNILPNISCSTECFPSCTSYWYKDKTTVPGIQANMLSLGDVYINDSGTYSCKSENTESNVTRENAIQLVVQYPPTISIESRNGSFSETGLMINCSAHGIPERYTYSLIHSSLFSDIKIQQLINNEPVSTGVFVHWFRNPSFMDTGVYTCIVSNGILDYRDGSLHKNVSRTVWITGPPNVTSSDRDFYAGKGDSGRLVIEFYNSLLDASVTWNKKVNQTLEKLESFHKYNISVDNATVGVKFYSVLIQQPGFITTLEITNVTEEDFCAYQVLLQNSVGNLSDLTLNLRPRGCPDVPKDVHIVTNRIATRSLDIEWVSGFHGGSNQTFVIEYKTQVDVGWNNYSHDVFGGMMQHKYYNITLDNLHQNTLYFFKLYAWNVFGRSDYSTTINATTYAESNKQEITDKVIIGGAVVLLSIMVAVVGNILYRRRRVQKPHGDGTLLELVARSEEINNRESGLVDNPLYVTTVAEYAVVVKPKKKAALVEDPSNLYAQVDKKIKNRKKGDIYENIDMGGKSTTADSECEDTSRTRTNTSDENVYENPGAVASNCPLVNKDGLIYVDLELDPPTTKNGKPVIRGIENRTDYADIAYGKRGEPLPDSDEENVDGVKRKRK